VVAPLKATLERLQADGETSAGPRVKVMFNPADFSITKASQLGEVTVPGLAAPLQQFVRGQAARLTVRLFFDSTDESMGNLASGVVKQTDKVYDLVSVDSGTHAPPIVRFVWGSSFPGSELPSGPSQRNPCFVGVVENLQQEFNLFSPLGIPLRAMLTLTLREYFPLKSQRERLRLGSPDRTHSRVLVEGQTLSALAGEVYGDPGAWRALAAHNRIDDPRRVPAGTALAVPPLPADQPLGARR
jgi:nucleoid-associated protein YgaU